MFCLVKGNFSCRSGQADKQSNGTFQWFSGLCSGCALGLLPNCLSAEGKTGTGENITVVMSCKSCPFLAMRLLFGSKCLFSCKLAAYSSVPSCTRWMACNAALHGEKNVLPVRGVCISQERSVPSAVLSSQAVNNWEIGVGGESVKTTQFPPIFFGFVVCMLLCITRGNVVHLYCQALNVRCWVL